MQTPETPENCEELTGTPPGSALSFLQINTTSFLSLSCNFHGYLRNSLEENNSGKTLGSMFFLEP
jgi:hypothetical protein